MKSESEKPAPVVLTVRDLAELLRCSERHVHSMHKAGKMPPALRVGKLLRWPRERITDWLRAA